MLINNVLDTKGVEGGGILLPRWGLFGNLSSTKFRFLCMIIKFKLTSIKS